MSYLRAGSLLVGMAALFVAIGSLFGAVGAATALALAIMTVFWSFWSTPAKLRAIGAVEITNPHLIAMVARLAAKAGIPTPRVFQIQEAQPNALAFGPNPDQAVIVLTAGLQSLLTERELSAVIGHELGHICYRDFLAATLGITFLDAIISLALILGLIGLALRRNGGGVILALALLFPLIALVLHLAMSRSTEYRADRFGAELCGNPRDLISALQKLEDQSRYIANEAAIAQPAFASTFVVDPFPDTWLSRIFSTHPATQRRIARLERLQIS